MCGLIGCSSELALDLDTIAHRGPDAAGEITVGRWRLGHSRLAIQDLSSASDQPVINGDVTVTYNGELWNPQELRQQLPGDWLTTGDTEVVVRALSVYDEQALPMPAAFYRTTFAEQFQGVKP